jgi:hypothetical protein
MMQLRKLWAGDLPLETAFWTYAFFGGLLVNATTTAAFLVLLAQDQPVAAALVGYGFSIPFNVLVTVGVWRSAGRDDARPGQATLYPLITTVSMFVLSVT